MIRARPVCYFETKPGIPSDLKEMVNGLYLFSIQFKLLVFFYSKPHSHTFTKVLFLCLTEKNDASGELGVQYLARGYLTYRCQRSQGSNHFSN